MKHIKLFENFEIAEPIRHGEPLNNKELKFLNGYNIMCPEWILKDDNYYYVHDHRCEYIKDLPLTYINGVCSKLKIQNYTINDDHTIDVDGNVNITYKSLTKIPLKFKNVSGYFACSDNKLTTLLGSPETVGRNFACNYNKLTTLEGGPKFVGDYYDCSTNKLTTLIGGPESSFEFHCYNNKLTTLEGSLKSVPKDYDCSNNQLTTLKGGPEYVGGLFVCHTNKLTTLEGGPKHVGGSFYCYDNPLTSFDDCRLGE